MIALETLALRGVSLKLVPVTYPGYAGASIDRSDHSGIIFHPHTACTSEDLNQLRKTDLYSGRIKTITNYCGGLDENGTHGFMYLNTSLQLVELFEKN